MTWKYRGQVVPKNLLVTVEIDITERGTDDRGRFALAEGSLWVDGKRIYGAKNLGMRVVAGPERLPPGSPPSPASPTAPTAPPSPPAPTVPAALAAPPSRDLASFLKLLARLDRGRALADRGPLHRPGRALPRPDRHRRSGRLLARPRPRLPLRRQPPGRAGVADLHHGRLGDLRHADDGARQGRTSGVVARAPDHPRHRLPRRHRSRPHHLLRPRGSRLLRPHRRAGHARSRGLDQERARPRRGHARHLVPHPRHPPRRLGDRHGAGRRRAHRPGPLRARPARERLPSASISRSATAARTSTSAPRSSPPSSRASRLRTARTPCSRPSTRSAPARATRLRPRPELRRPGRGLASPHRLRHRRCRVLCHLAGASAPESEGVQRLLEGARTGEAGYREWGEGSLAGEFARSLFGSADATLLVEGG